MFHSFQQGDDFFFEEEATLTPGSHPSVTLPTGNTKVPTTHTSLFKSFETEDELGFLEEINEKSSSFENRKKTHYFEHETKFQISNYVVNFDAVLHVKELRIAFYKFIKFVIFKF
jgi:hypothetical protein